MFGPMGLTLSEEPAAVGCCAPEAVALAEGAFVLDEAVVESGFGVHPVATKTTIRAVSSGFMLAILRSFALTSIHVMNPISVFPQQAGVPFIAAVEIGTDEHRGLDPLCEKVLHDFCHDGIHNRTAGYG